MNLAITLHSLIVWLILGMTASAHAANNESWDYAPLAAMSAFQKGIVYASWLPDEYASTASDRTLAQAIKPLGVNWISVVVTCYQDNISATQIQCKPETLTPTDADLAHIIQDAHRSGLRVMLKPHIDLCEKSMHWRGEIGFGTDETAWQAWFKSYTDFISHYAILAQQHDVDYLIVGTELVKTTPRSKDWRNIIKTVRKLYSGPLTYSAHHSDEEFMIDWWDELDAIGIDAYYPLANNAHPTVAQITAAWQPIVARLGQLSEKYARPVILTEIGYESLAGTNRTPWQTKGNTLAFQEQADCYHAVFEAFSGKTWWHGVFWWVWEVNLAQDPNLNNHFCPYNKPADQVLKSHYQSKKHASPGMR